METVLTTLITAAATLTGVWLTLRYESKKRLSEERRWYADYFLSKKISALTDLHEALVDCHFTMNHYGNCPPRSLLEFKEKVQLKEDVYLRAKVMASLYLDEEGDKIMSNVLGSFRQASMAIWLHLPAAECPVNANGYDDKTRSVDWPSFVSSYDAAIDYIKCKLNPKLLEQLPSDVFPS